MGQLRDRMEQDLKLKGVSPATIRNYLLYCRKVAAFCFKGLGACVAGEGPLPGTERSAFIRRQFAPGV